MLVFFNHVSDKVMTSNGCFFNITRRITWNEEVIDWVFKWDWIICLDLSTYWNGYHIFVCHWYSLKHSPWSIRFEYQQQQPQQKDSLEHCIRLLQIHNSGPYLGWFLKPAHLKRIAFLQYLHIRCFEFLLTVLAHFLLFVDCVSAVWNFGCWTRV